MLHVLSMRCEVGKGHVLAPIASASQHEVAPWFGTAVVWDPRISMRIF